MKIIANKYTYIPSFITFLLCLKCRRILLPKDLKQLIFDCVKPALPFRIYQNYDDDIMKGSYWDKLENRYRIPIEPNQLVCIYRKGRRKIYRILCDSLLDKLTEIQSILANMFYKSNDRTRKTFPYFVQYIREIPCLLYNKPAIKQDGTIFNFSQVNPHNFLIGPYPKLCWISPGSTYWWKMHWNLHMRRIIPIRLDLMISQLGPTFTTLKLLLPKESAIMSKDDLCQELIEEIKCCYCPSIDTCKYACTYKQLNGIHIGQYHDQYINICQNCVRSQGTLCPSCFEYKLRKQICHFNSDVGNTYMCKCGKWICRCRRCNPNKKLCQKCYEQDHNNHQCSFCHAVNTKWCEVCDRYVCDEHSVTCEPCNLMVCQDCHKERQGCWEEH